MNKSSDDVGLTASTVRCTGGVTSPSDVEIYSQVATIAILSLVSLVSNVILISTIIKTAKLRTNINIYLVNVAASDLVISSVVLPTWALTTWYQEMVYTSSLCIGVAVLTMTSLLVSMTMLAGMTVDRFLQIRHPLRYVIMVSRRRVMLFVMTTWFASLLLALFPVMQFGGRYDFRPGCVPICRLNYVISIPYVIGFISVGLAPQFVVMSLCYCVIVSMANHRARRIEAVLPAFVNKQPPDQTPPCNPPGVINAWVMSSDAKTRTERWVAEADIPSKPYFRYRAGSSIETGISIAASASRDTYGVTSVSAPISPVAHAPISRRVKLVSTSDLWRKATKTVKKSVSQTRALRTVLAIIGVFVACWIPYMALVGHVIVGGANASYRLEFAVTFVAFMTSVTSPLISVGVNREFQKAVVGLASVKRRRMLRLAVAAFVESGRRGVESPQYPARQPTSASDVTSEASDVLMVRSVYQKFMLSQQNDD